MNYVRVIITKVENLNQFADVSIGVIAKRYWDKYLYSKPKEESDQAFVTGLLLRKYLGIYKDDQFVIEKYGKLNLINSNFYCNISHCKEYVALAISHIPIGIDIEQVTKISWSAAKKVFDCKKYEKLKELNEKEQDITFTKMWTETEAVLKLKGTGFSGEIEGNHEVLDCFLNSIFHNDYIITCATYGNVNIKLEEKQIFEIM